MSAGRFIVMFKSTATPEQIAKFAETVSTDGGQVTHNYDIIKGFAANLNEKTLQSFQSSLQAPDNIIETIEADGVVTTQ
ncbi:hypothetical protein C8J57DRAFT_1284212 [Mycena rebaudengoi]|nr:hypothetical protein C8J57DRAFT_1284212 [Mycena rebaudengoi]